MLPVEHIDKGEMLIHLRPRRQPPLQYALIDNTKASPKILLSKYAGALKSEQKWWLMYLGSNQAAAKKKIGS